MLTSRQDWFLRGIMKKSIMKATWIILPIVLFCLFSYSSAQEKPGEPKDAEFYNNRGMDYREKGFFDRAISDYNKSLEINPWFAEAYYNRGRAYYLKGEYDKSLGDIERAQDLGCKIPPKLLDDLRNASRKKD